MLRSTVRTAGASAFIASNVLAVAGDNTTCPGPLLDWYTEYVGETPCMTYQRLRQLCDAQYTVPLFRNTAPGDNCDSEVSACCCNSVAWSLSMLCKNCQEHAVANSTSPTEAASGAYYKYRFANSTSDQGYCGNGDNGTLSTQVQSAVCNSDIKIADWLYPLYWGDGSWYYTNFMDQAELNQTATNNNTFTHCNATDIASNATSTSLVSATPTTQGETSSSASVSSTAAAGAVKSRSNNTGAIVGGVVGGVLGLLVILLAAALFLRKRKAGLAAANASAGSGDVPPMSTVEPPVAANGQGLVPYDVPRAYPIATIGRPLAGKQDAVSRPSSRTNFTPATSDASATRYTRTGTSNMSSDTSRTVVASMLTMPVVLESEVDAGRLTMTALRPPPAYRSSWDDRNEHGQ